MYLHLPPSLSGRLSSSLMATSDSHSECWVAKAWHQTRNTALSAMERSQASVLLQNVRLAFMIQSPYNYTLHPE